MRKKYIYLGIFLGVLGNRCAIEKKKKKKEV